MARHSYLGLSAVLAAGVADTGTTLTFAAPLTHSGGTSVPSVVAPNVLPLSILSAAGVLLEVVHVTAYTAGATTATVTRGMEGTTAAARASGLIVVHSPTLKDIPRQTSVNVQVLANGRTTPSSATKVNLGVEAVHSDAEVGDILSLSPYLNWGTAPAAVYGYVFGRVTSSSSPVIERTFLKTSVPGAQYLETSGEQCIPVTSAMINASGQVVVQWLWSQDTGSPGATFGDATLKSSLIPKPRA